MKRRDFMTLIGGATVAWPLAARAQHTRRLGILIGTSNDSQGRSWIAAFREKLQELGWVDGRDVQIDIVWGGADIDYIRANAAKMASAKPDVILVYSVRVLNAVRQATDQILIVFIATNDPVGLGIVKSLAHPGGNPRLYALRGLCSRQAGATAPGIGAASRKSRSPVQPE